MKLKLIAPLFLILIAIASEYSGFDVGMERIFYDAGTHTWPLKNGLVTSALLHTAGKNLVVAAMVSVLLVLVLTFFVKRLRPLRKGAAYLLAGTLLGVIIVSILKSSTHIYTPWNLQMFGGDKPYIRLFDPAPAGLPVGHGFPGGHSSGGFGFLSVYFLLSFYAPRYRYFGLALGLGLGGVFAIAQELRGAHFLSHDLFSLVICWYAALLVFELMFRKELRLRRSPGPTAHPTDAPQHLGTLSVTSSGV
jgi:membrane-associated PAP2 superfamily phosphatase